MSPSASTLQSSQGSRRPSSARNVPAAGQLTDPSSTRPSRSSPKPSSPAPAPSKPVHYTLILRFPFARNGFQDPEPVSWDATKDKALWKIISKASNSKDLDWEAIAERFEVALSFLMQQAAWLYERHFEGMKVQMRRLTTGMPSTAADAGGSGTKETRVPSATGSRKDSPLPAGELPSPKTAVAPAFSRTPSTTTITQSRLGSGPSGLRQRALRTSGGSHRRPGTPNTRAPDDDDTEMGHDDNDEDASESEEEPSMTRSQAFRRPPLGGAASKPTLGTLSSEGDEASSEDDPSSSGGYLPFATATTGTGLQAARDPDPAATLRGQSPRRGTGTQRGSSKQRHPPPPTNRHDSSTSASASSASASTSNVQPPARPGPLSPRHRAQLAAMSPRSRRAEGSEGTPSMGSSFSDLDDASVTQSALEEALMSNLQAGGGSIASRMSSLGRAFGGGRREG